LLRTNELEQSDSLRNRSPDYRTTGETAPVRSRDYVAANTANLAEYVRLLGDAAIIPLRFELTDTAGLGMRSTILSAICP